MSGDYLFPKRVYRTHQPVTVKGLNRNIQPAGERFSGRLVGHNLESRVRGLTAPLAAESVNKVHDVEAVVDIGVSRGATGFPTTTGSGPDSTYEVSNSYEWEMIANSADSAKDMRISITPSGTSLVKIDAWLQYYKAGLEGVRGVGSDTWATGHYSAAVQFGLRIDGEIVRDSVTGFREESEANHWPIKPAAAKSIANFIPPRRINGRRSHAMGPGCKPVRLAWIVLLGPGEHTVEIVARRTYMQLTRKRSVWGGIYVASRKLICIEHPVVPAAANSSSLVTVPAFEAEQTVSAATLATDRIIAIRDAANQSSGAGLTAGAFARGALHEKHLPSPLLACDQGTLEPASDVTTNNDYPSFTSNTVVAYASGRTGNNGWWQLEDGAGANYLRADNGGSGFGASTADDASYFVVSTDFELVGIDRLAGLTTIIAFFGAFAIGYYSNGVPTIIDGAIGFVNDFNKHLAGGVERTRADERTTVSLLAKLDLRTSRLSHDIDYFAVYGSGIDATFGVVNGVQLKWRRGAIQVLQYRY